MKRWAAVPLLLLLLLFPCTVSAASDALHMGGNDNSHLGGVATNFSDPGQTLMAWVYVDSDIDRNQVLLLMLDDVLFNGWWVRINADGVTLECGIYLAGVETDVHSGSVLTMAKWYFVAIQRSGTTITVFLGDESSLPTSNCTSTSASLPAQTGDYGVGFGGAGGSGNSLAGRLTSYRHYNAVLSLGGLQTESRALYTASSTTNLFSNNAVRGQGVDYGNSGGSPGYTFTEQGIGFTTSTAGGPTLTSASNKAGPLVGGPILKGLVGGGLVR